MYPYPSWRWWKDVSMSYLDTSNNQSTCFISLCIRVPDNEQMNAPFWIPCLFIVRTVWYRGKCKKAKMAVFQWKKSSLFNFKDVTRWIDLSPLSADFQIGAVFLVRLWIPQVLITHRNGPKVCDSKHVWKKRRREGWADQLAPCVRKFFPWVIGKT